MHNFDHNIGFWEKRQFFAENWRKSQKIVIITSIPDVSLKNAQSEAKPTDLFCVEKNSTKIWVTSLI
jgi:hypothetical protein